MSPKKKSTTGPSSTRRKKEEVTDVFSALTTPVTGRSDYTQINVTITRAHMRVLDAEASLYGLRKSQFLELLFLNAIGQPAITRLPISPKYELGRDELGETVKYLWYIRKEVKKLLEEHMHRTGMKFSGWLVSTLNEWAGLTRPLG